MKNLILFLIFTGLLFPSLSFSQQADLPENPGEVKILWEKVLKIGETEIPRIAKKIWEEQVLPIWQGMYRWAKDHIWTRFYSWFQKVISPEIEKRKPQIKEEFEKEKEEARQEIPKVGKSLWEKFKEIIR